MNLRIVGLAFLVSVSTFAHQACAEYGFTYTFQYSGSYTADWSEGPMLLPEVDTPAPGGMVNRTIACDGIHTVHSYNVYITATDLAADEDIIMAMAVGNVGGAVAQDNLTEATNKNEYVVDPPPMGGSDAPPAIWDLTVVFNSVPTIACIVRYGTTSGAGGDKYGDYAAYMQLGESGSGQGYPFFLGTCFFHTPEFNIGMTGPEVDQVTWSSDASKSYFKTITGNIDGMGTAATATYKHDYAFYGDVLSFGVPEPSALALLATAVSGLLAYAWRKQRRGSSRPNV
jgi:hypothetical protein